MAIERITPSDHEEWRRVGLHHLQRYEFAGRFTKDAKVLDLACGNGYGSFALMNFGAKTVRGVDIDPGAIEYASSHYRRPGLTYACGDAFAEVSVEGGYGVVVSFETIEHLAEPKLFISKLRDLVSPDGLLVISAPNALQCSRAATPVLNPFHVSEPTYDEFCDWLSDDFVVEQEWEQSPAVMNFNAQGELLQYSSFARVILAFEQKLKSLIRHRSVDAVRKIVRRRSSYCEITTTMQPLMPERKNDADVFVFVCRPKTSQPGK